MQNELGRPTQQHDVAPVQVDGNWLWFADPTTTTCPQYAPFDDPGVLDAFVHVEQPADALAFARQYGFLGWSDAGPMRHDRAVWAEFRATRSQHRRDRYDADYVPWVLAHAAALRWMQEVVRLQGGVEVPLDMTQVPEPPPGTLAARERPFVDALNVVRDALNVGLMDVHWQVARTGPHLAVSWQGWTLLDALYVLMAQRLTYCSTPGGDGRLVRCADPACGRTFYTTNPRVEWCPPGPKSRRGGPFKWDGTPSKSPCASRFRQRRLRAERRAKGLTSRNDIPKRLTTKDRPPAGGGLNIPDEQ